MQFQASTTNGMDIFRKDKAWVGALAGLIMPIVMYVIINELNNMVKGTNFMPEADGFSLQLRLIASMVPNFLLFMMYNTSKKEKAMRGILGVTMLEAFLIILTFWKDFDLNL